MDVDVSRRLVPSPSEVLHRAVQRVLGRLDDLYPLLAPGGLARAEAYLGTLRSRLDQVIAGADPEPTRRWLAESPLFEPLMEVLGCELIEDPVDDPAAAVVRLQALRAWASLRATPTFDPAPSQPVSDDIRAEMSGPGAFELLVEVAHDFRSPLTSILFLADAIREGHSGPVTDVQRSQLGLIYSAAFGLSAIASDVMDLARQEKDLIAGEPQPFAVAEMFASVERMVRPLVEEKRLQLRVVAPDRWQSRGHPHALSRVLLNLTTNALKFTDEGTVEIGVHPQTHGRLEYYVQDTGRGIAPEQQRDLFRAFRKRSGRSRDDYGYYFSGSGIGLSIARRLLRAMGSDLNLDSSNESGTRFSFILPGSGRS